MPGPQDALAQSLAQLKQGAIQGWDYLQGLPQSQYIKGPPGTQPVRAYPSSQVGGQLQGAQAEYVPAFQAVRYPQGQQPPSGMVGRHEVGHRYDPFTEGQAPENPNEWGMSPQAMQWAAGFYGRQLDPMNPSDWPEIRANLYALGFFNPQQRGGNESEETA